MNDAETTTRKPMLLFLLLGLFLLRYEQRTFLSLLLNAPPRNTRAKFVGWPRQMALARTL